LFDDEQTPAVNNIFPFINKLNKNIFLKPQRKSDKDESKYK